MVILAKISCYVEINNSFFVCTVAGAFSCTSVYKCDVIVVVLCLFVWVHVILISWYMEYTLALNTYFWVEVVEGLDLQSLAEG